MAIVKSGPPVNIDFFLPGTTKIHPSWVDWFNKIDGETGGVSGLADTSTTAIADLPTELGLGGLAYQDRTDLTDLDGAGLKTTDDVQLTYDIPNLTERTPAFTDDVIFEHAASETGAARVSIEDLMSIGGGVLQIVTTSSNAQPDITTTIPTDDTIPKITEGTQILSASITPRRADSTLFIIAKTNMKMSAQGNTMALFRDSTTLAINSNYIRHANNGVADMSIFHTESSDDTVSTTFQVRLGSDNGGTINLLQNDSGTPICGGTNTSSLWIVEYVSAFTE
jgi:hypothetical protein